MQQNLWELHTKVFRLEHSGKYNTISFNGNKIITGSSGGCFLTNDEEAANKVRKWSTTGERKCSMVSA